MGVAVAAEIAGGVVFEGLNGPSLLLGLFAPAAEDPRAFSPGADSGLALSWALLDVEKGFLGALLDMGGNGELILAFPTSAGFLGGAGGFEAEENDNVCAIEPDGTKRD